MKEGATLVSFIWRMQNPELMKKLTAKKINVLAMDAVPRISRAQALDALLFMANISGYRAVIEAAHEKGLLSAFARSRLKVHKHPKSRGAN